MKCAEFSKIVHDLARSQGLSGAEAAIARAHAEMCPACACRLEEAEELAAILKSVSAESRSLGAPESTESALMVALRGSKSGQSHRWKRRWQPMLGWASAAAVALLLVFATLGRTPVHRSEPANAAKVGSSGPTVARLETTASISATESRNSTVQPMSGFVPVPFAGGFARGDSGVIVRVQVPRAALAELGYPADEMQGQGMVQADLLVGEDGWPRAVRIVKETSER